jgi:hypothetical protein
MTIKEFEAAKSDSFEGALLALWWDAHGDWERAHQVDRMSPGRMARGFMLICIARRAMMGMRPIGTGRRGAGWSMETWGRNGSRL